MIRIFGRHHLRGWHMLARLPCVRLAISSRSGTARAVLDAARAPRPWFIAQLRSLRDRRCNHCGGGRSRQRQQFTQREIELPGVIEPAPLRLQQAARLRNLAHPHVRCSGDGREIGELVLRIGRIRSEQLAYRASRSPVRSDARSPQANPPTLCARPSHRDNRGWT